MATPVAPGFRGTFFSARAAVQRLVLASAALGLAATVAAATDLAPWSAAPKPALVLDTVDGPPLDLAVFDGRPVLVHFFATWCAPCIEEMAGLVRLAASPLGADLPIVAVDVGEVDIRVRRFRDAQGLTFPVLLDRDRAAARAWGIVGLPTTLILDASRTGGLLAEGDVDWDAPTTRTAIDRLIEDQGRTEPHDEAT